MKINPQITALEKRIGYTFTDHELAVRCMTHSSYGDGRRLAGDNERLEFLGDRILGLMTAERLFEIVDDQEGDMARKLNALVRKETCARIARKAGIGEALQLSPAEERQGGREKTSILGDACEALLAAIYIDGGIEAVSIFYKSFWADEIALVLNESMKDPKTELQERAFAAGGGAPIYTVLERSGPDHRPLFIISVEVDKIGSAQGTGKSKKDAERFAARHLLESWPK
jgi:ribonuclease-3